MKIGEGLDTKTDKNCYSSSDKLTDNDTFIGVEIELEDCNYHKVCSSTVFDPFFWEIKSEESLRKGLEFIFKRPMKGGNLIKALGIIDELFTFFKSKDITPTLSQRTSLHIHLDIRDLESKDINEIIKLYMLFEGILFDYVGYHRIKSNYCRPLLGSNFTTILSKLGSISDLGEYLHFITQNCEKYSALNMKTISSFGSLEFRHHPGTLDTSLIIEWINILLSLKKYAVSKSVDKVLHLPVNEAVIEVFGVSLAEKLLKVDSEHLYESDKLSLIDYMNEEILEQETFNILKKNSKIKKENTLMFKYLEGKK